MTAHLQEYRLVWDAREARAAAVLSETGELATAVMISLFSDARAPEDDPNVQPGDNRRGWWADAFNDRPIGSLLWTMYRAPTVSDAIQRVEQHAKDALQWLIDDGVAAEVRVSAERMRRNWLGLQVEVLQPDDLAPRWRGTWEVPFVLQ